MLRNKSLLEALHGVEELDNQAAETIWGGTFDPEKLPPGAVYIDIGPETHFTLPACSLNTSVEWLAGNLESDYCYDRQSNEVYALPWPLQYCEPMTRGSNCI